MQRPDDVPPEAWENIVERAMRVCGKEPAQLTYADLPAIRADLEREQRDAAAGYNAAMAQVKAGLAESGR